MSLSRRALLLAAGAAPLGARAAVPVQIVCPLAVAPKVLIPGVSHAFETRLLGSKIYGGLCRIDGRGVPQPELASGWEVSADGLTYVFHLRPGLLWHDSGAVTADDVVFSIDRFHRSLQPRLGLKRVVAVRARDERTVAITLDAPFEPFLRQMDALSAPIVPQHVHDQLGFALDPQRTMPVGTGPFRLAEWLRLQRFEWFDGAKPDVAHIICPILTDTVARLALLDQPGVLLAGGAIDLAEIPPLQRMASLAVDAQPANAIAGLRLNHAIKPLDDPRVRLAVASAIDRVAILRDVWFGFGHAATGPALSASQDRNPAATLPAYDLRAASGLLAEAGLRPDDNGIRLRLSHIVPPGPLWQRLASRLRVMLEHVGIALVPDQLTQAEWFHRVAAGDYQMTGFLAEQTSDLSLDLGVYIADQPAIGPMLVTSGAARASALLEAQALLVRDTARVWLVEPAIPVVRDRRLVLPGGLFTDFAQASLPAEPGPMNQ